MNNILNILCLIFLNNSIGYSEEQNDPFTKLADDLTVLIPSGKPSVRLGVGNFLYQNTEMMSPFSMKIRDEMEIKLGKKNGVEMVARDRLADLENEAEFQKSYALVEPGSKVGKLKVKGIEGIVRGRFYVEGSSVVVYAEVVWLPDGKIDKTKTICSLKDFERIVYPDTPERKHAKEKWIVPQNVEDSQKGIEEIALIKMGKIKHEIDLEFRTNDGERFYREGDILSFRVKANRTCHIAVICHQNDGTSVILFPNQWHRDTLIPANSRVEIPGTSKSGFEIEVGPPFGSDVVQVIACTDENSLHREIKEMVAKMKKEDPPAVMPRGLFTKKAETAFQKDLSGKIQWGERHIVVSTSSKDK